MSRGYEITLDDLSCQDKLIEYFNRDIEHFGTLLGFKIKVSDFSDMYGGLGRNNPYGEYYVLLNPQRVQPHFEKEYISTADHGMTDGMKREDAIWFSQELAKAIIDKKEITYISLEIAK